jgi:two-component system chemotaxis response regulator CheB
MGASAGGLQALAIILGGLESDFTLPILVVQHLHATDDGRFAAHLGDLTTLEVVEPCDKEPIVAGQVYVAPANYHMLVETDETIALSIDERVNHSRPSIDVLFESAAHVFGARLIAVILSGASHDGALGMCAVNAHGGLAIAQDPEGAEHPVMPRAAIQAAGIQTVLPPRGIAERLSELSLCLAGESHERSDLVPGGCR